MKKFTKIFVLTLLSSSTCLVAMENAMLPAPVEMAIPPAEASGRPALSATHAERAAPPVEPDQIAMQPAAPAGGARPHRPT